MRIQILSDLHLEFETFDIDTSETDILILAGDIHVKDKALNWIFENIKDIPILYVLGNHEYYGETYPKLITKMKEQCQGSNVHVLENEVLTIQEVNFLGCTLWTDFALFGDPRLTGFECQQVMTDFKKIRKLPNYSKIRSLDLAAIHSESRQWLTQELEKRKGEINVVVTHHAPSLDSLPAYRRDDMISAAYASDLTEFIHTSSPRYWIHGHLHNSADYKVGECRVLCNPKGYPDELNVEFDPRFVIEIADVPSV